MDVVKLILAEVVGKVVNRSIVDNISYARSTKARIS